MVVGRQICARRFCYTISGVLVREELSLGLAALLTTLLFSRVSQCNFYRVGRSIHLLVAIIAMDDVADTWQLHFSCRGLLQPHMQVALKPMCAVAPRISSAQLTRIGLGALN